MPEDTLLQDTRTWLRCRGVHARKSLGQHFLVDAGVLEAIIGAAELAPSDTVIEVGPGLGVLTRALAERAGRVVCLELDENLLAGLRGMPYPNLTVLQGDIREVDLAALTGGTPAYKVVANLPFYVAAPALRRFLEASSSPSLLVVMVQKEVALSLVARPGNLSILGVAVQFYGEPELVVRVPANSFYPAPKVDSAVVRIRVRLAPLLPPPATGFFALVRAGFSAPRKQLRNSLAHGLAVPVGDAEQLLRRAGADPRRRAETLSLEEWLTLYRVWEASKPKNSVNMQAGV